MDEELINLENLHQRLLNMEFGIVTAWAKVEDLLPHDVRQQADAALRYMYDMNTKLGGLGSLTKEEILERFKP